MTSVTNISGSTGTPIVQTPALPSVQAVGGFNTGSVAVSQPQTFVSQSRLVSDPLSGSLITQDLDNKGQVISQFPSSAVVAYLQQGLLPEGYPAKPQHATTA
jgi:hypothetical protein